MKVFIAVLVIVPLLGAEAYLWVKGLQYVPPSPAQAAYPRRDEVYFLKPGKIHYHKGWFWMGAERYKKVDYSFQWMGIDVREESYTTIIQPDRPIRNRVTIERAHRLVVEISLWWTVVLAIPAVALILFVAFRIVDSVRYKVRTRRGRCVGCNYDLTGNTSGVCPECGTRIPEVVGSAPKTE